MKIVIDARFYGLEHTGLGRYTTSFLTTLAQTPSPHHYYLLLKKKYYQSLSWPDNFTPLLADIPHYSWQEQILLPRLVDKLHSHLYHALHFNIPLFIKTPFLVTIHDLIKSHFTSFQTTTRFPLLFYLKRLGYQRVIHHAVYKSLAIVVPSHFVKQDILKHFPLTKDKIFPIYEAPHLVSSTPPSLSLPPQPYLLYVGNAYPHKNIALLLSAFRSLPDHLHLVIVSRPTPFLKRVLQPFSSLQSRLHIFSHLSDADLSLLYQHAQLVVIPSLMEGFSLTGLEALSFSTPVVASDIPTHREIYGSAVRYANPHDVAAFTQAIMTSLQDKYRGRLPRSYSWQNFTNQILQLYEKCRSRL